MLPTTPTPLPLTVARRQFVVDRRTWYRGRRSNNSYLFWNDQKCCLGFVALECGIESNRIAGVARPDDFDVPDRADFPEWLFYGEISETNIDHLVIMNDSQTLTDAEREARIAEVFRRNGDEISFIN